MSRTFWLAATSAVVLAAAPALAQDSNVTIIQPDGTQTEAGEAVENAAEATADAAGDAADATVDAAQTAGEAMENAAEATGEAAADAADATADAVETADETVTVTVEETEVEAETDAEVTVIEPEEIEQPVEGQMFEQSPDQYLASSLMGAEVMNAAEDEIGEVSDMILSQDGSVEGVIIGVGGFLGIGEKDVAIELSRLQITQDEDGELTFMLDATEGELENAPEFITAAEAERERGGMATTPAVGTAPPAPAAPAAPTTN